MTLSDRLNQIIDEQKLSKREFAKRIGISENYLYILTGNSRPDSACRYRGDCLSAALKAT